VDKGENLVSPGWLEAGQLLPGDRIRSISGEVVVADLRANAGHAAVYTLTVERDHTFFVGTARVLVHNGFCPVLKITGQSLIHIVYRHLNASELARALTAAGKVSAKDIVSTAPAGQFLPGMTTGELRQLIVSAFDHANRISAFQLQGGRYIADVTMDRVIGHTISGQATRLVRLILANDGKIITIYPLG
jgi:hypothetical protein